jgi:hypothetical protein
MVAASVYMIPGVSALRVYSVAVTALGGELAVP